MPPFGGSFTNYKAKKQVLLNSSHGGTMAKWHVRFLQTSIGNY